MKFHDLFNYREYMQMHDQGYVRENHHPTLDLIIYNYTEKAQFDNEWNNVTTKCRGLIVNSKGLVVARPFDKFLNYGQNQADIMLMDYPVVATDKMDGSLGILWDYEGEQGIATRGSFTSDQAVHATELWKRIGFPALKSHTYMFEIIYPENRIVLDYGDMDALVLLGCRSIEDGSVWLPNTMPEWSGPVTQTFPYKTLREALTAPQRPNAEGLVVYFPDLDYRIKIKQEDYVALHKIVTGLTERRVWESMKEGKTLEDLCSIVPDEWYEWLNETYWHIDTELRVISGGVFRDYFKHLATASIACENSKDTVENFVRARRKHFALEIKDHPYKELLFLMFDGNDEKFRDRCYELVKPSVQ